MNESIRVEKTVTINRTLEELYSYWRNFENLPQFMKHLKYVKVCDEKRSHWIASAPFGNSVEWDVEIIKEQENHLIAWASVEGAKFENSGLVRFQKAANGRGTEVKVVIKYNLPGGAIAAVAKLLCQEPEQELSHALRRFKRLMEADKVVTTESQPGCAAS